MEIYTATAIIAGILMVFILTRLLHKLVYEIAIMGAIYGATEWWRYWGVASLGLPPAPEWIYIFTASLAATWIIMRILFIFSLFIPQLVPISMWINGR